MAKNGKFISVVLPVYNAEKYLAESVESILRQTHENFELIIINDGSKDNSAAVVKSFSDPRIVYIEQENAGLAATLNRGISTAKYEYIARQDNDDISEPQRFEKQIEFLEANKDVALVGSWASIIDENGQAVNRHHKHFVNNAELKFALLFDNPFVHSSVMFLKSAWKKAGGYNTDRAIFEDYYLWSSLSKHYKIANIPEYLLQYREVQTGMSKSSKNYDAIVSKKSAENIADYSGFSEMELKAFTEKTCDEKTYFRMINKIAYDFSSRENISLHDIKRVIASQLFTYKRHRFNLIINSDKSGSFEKFRARIGRKFLFLLNHPS